MGLIWYTADHEEPDCMRCQNLGNDEKFCIKHCGAEHCWNGYLRTEHSNDFHGDLYVDEYYRLLTESTIKVLGK